MRFSEEWKPVLKVAGTDAAARQRGRESLRVWLSGHKVDMDLMDEGEIRVDPVVTPLGPGLRFSVKKTPLLNT